ncbi:MAG: hypothetical protein WCE90_00645 [Candidatus Zixiibacteriota bacterium]
MKARSLVLAWLACGVLLLFNQAWSACPQDPYDSGICDTMLVEVYPPDQLQYPPPFFVRFPICLFCLN